MNYIELSLYLYPDSPANRELLVSTLSEAGYDSFWEEEDVLRAYTSEDMFNENRIHQLQDQLKNDVSFSFESQSLPDQNWNAEWEKNFQPVRINEKCAVRAPFHTTYQDIKYELIINPQMSFGTSHHETTSLILNMMTQMEIKDREVLDMGSGTGILAIMADKKQAARVIAVDNDPWAYGNTLENIETNQSQVEVMQGDIEQVHDQSFDLILANINRNIILNHMPAYSKMLRHKGQIIFSGFYSEDLESIQQAAKKNNFAIADYDEMRNWIIALFTKQ